MSDNVTRRGFIGAAGAAAGGMLLAGAEGQAQAAEGRKKLKIIAVSCSRREGASTAGGLKIALEAAKAVAPEKIDTELIDLAGKQLQAQVAAGLEVPPGQSDDFLPIAEKIGDPQVAGLIIGTPVYYSSMSSVCKDFIERLGVFHKECTLSNVVGSPGDRLGAQRRPGDRDHVDPGRPPCPGDSRRGRGRKTTRFGAASGQAPKGALKSRQTARGGRPRPPCCGSRPGDPQTGVTPGIGRSPRGPKNNLTTFRSCHVLRTTPFSAESSTSRRCASCRPCL